MARRDSETVLIPVLLIETVRLGVSVAFSRRERRHSSSLDAVRELSP